MSGSIPSGISTVADMIRAEAANPPHQCGHCDHRCCALFAPSHGFCLNQAAPPDRKSRFQEWAAPGCDQWSGGHA